MSIAKKVFFKFFLRDCVHVYEICDEFFYMYILDNLRLMFVHDHIEVNRKKFHL